jgi:hypothetical protein
MPEIITNSSAWTKIQVSAMETGHIQWLSEAPRFKRVHVILVADDTNELEETQEANVAQPNGARLVDI